jgi:hypothetical protein
MKKIAVLFTIPLALFAAPKNPSNLVLTPYKDAVKIEWSDNASSEKGYKIFRDNKLIYITKGNEKSYYDSDLESDHTYSYTVKATDDVDVDSSGKYFLQALTSQEHHVITDSKKELMWVDEESSSKKGCLAVHGDREGDYTKSVSFCEELSFAGFDDWRDPTSDELYGFIMDTNALGIETGYLAPCKELLARDENGYESVISTRFNDSKPLGAKREYTPYEYNVGLRCVRDY